MLITRIIQIIIIALPSVLFGWLLVQEIVPSGVFVVNHSVEQPSPFIDQILPEQRVLGLQQDQDGDWVKTIIGDPAFFFVHPHRHFDQITTEVWFKNSGVPIVELGGLSQIEGQVYDLKPLQNLIIDQSDWFYLEDQGLTLLQRHKKYSSIKDFLEKQPDRGQIATYNYSLDQPYFLNGYQPGLELTTTNVSLRGFHVFKTYIKDEKLSFDFEYMDMNRTEGQDPITVLVFSEAGELVASQIATDDGNISNNAQPSTLQNLSISATNLSEGVYKIELKTTSDIFFRSFTTPQSKIVFMDNVRLADEVGYKENPRPVSFWTESKQLAFQTRHVEGVQMINIGTSGLDLKEPYQRFAYQIEEPGITGVLVPKGDVEVFSSGHIAFAKNQFFNPDPVRLRYNTDLDQMEVDYIIADYHQ
ncbi:hypothetical protein ACFLZY_02220, partial [Patescibacteria group bacterium]